MDTSPGHRSSSPVDAGLPPVPTAPGYAVDRLLGVGASGAVWLVHNDAGQRFALKVPAGAGHRAFEARREVNVLARLEHPHLVPLHGVAETDQGDGLVVGYAAGGSAGALVAARGPVPPGEAVTVLVGIADALAYLHARGTAHGDVSPANILFTAGGKPQLADFGQSRLLGEPGSPISGTPGFTAPEAGGAAGRRAARSSIGSAGDIYALAAVGWFLLTGNVPPPVRDRPPLSLLVPGVGRELPALLEAGLAEDPEQRPSAEEMAAWAYRGAAALPVDLVASAHPEVRPELMTRRTGSAARGGAEKGGLLRGLLRRRGGHGRGGRNRRGNDTGDWPGAGGMGEAGGRSAGAGRSRRVPTGRRRLRSMPGVQADTGQRESGDGGQSRLLPRAAAVLVVSVLLLAGIALAAPDLLRTDSNRSAGPASRPAVSSRVPAPAHPAATVPAPTMTAPAAEAATGGTTLPPPVGTAGPPAGPAPGPPDPGTPVEVLLERTRAEDPAQAVPALAELRALAFSSADARLLDHVDVPGSEAMLADRKLVSLLLQEGRRFRGLSLAADVLAAVPGSAGTPQTTGPGAAARRAVQLGVRLKVGPYQQVDAAGTVLAEEPAQQQDVVLELVQTAGEWKISRVLVPE